VSVLNDRASVKRRSNPADAIGSRFRVVLVEPEKERNIGSVARSMKNFGLTDLRLVSPKTSIGDEAYRYATRGREILEKAQVFETLPEALRDVDHVVGTTAIVGRSTRNLLRITIDPAQLASRLAKTTGSVALLFGRESSGLSNTELQQCDLIVSIPASEDYNVLNVATAASIVFYEIFKEVRSAHTTQVEPSRQSVERLASIFSDLADTADLPAHRRRLADRAFRNVLAKSVISRREVSLIMGVLRRIRDKTQSERTRAKKMTHGRR
jgi:TrmH family RNA methyltransferase